MELISLDFAGFVGITLLFYYLIPKRIQNQLLLAASYIFYGLWDIRFTAILAITTILNYQVGKRAAGRKRIMWLGVGGNLLALAFFRLVASGYMEKIINYVNRTTDSQRIYLHILIPIGFSFYILTAISYLVDVYKKQIPPADNFFDFALLLAYFPKMLSGPIERAKTFFPQLAKKKTLDNQRLSLAFLLIITGFFRKMFFAELISKAIPVNLFNESNRFGAPELIIYLILYVFWLYNDFAGYTGIARGISALFGIDLLPNFEQPFFARSFVEFWNRWHISLSNWLRDYIYYPVSRSLLRLNRNQRNLVNICVPPLATMLASGLWHNFGLYMLVWGGMHGVFQVVERLLIIWKPGKAANEQPVIKQIASMVVVFIFVSLAFVSFGSGSFSRALLYWQGMVTGWGKPFILKPIGLVAPGIAILLCLVLDYIQYRTKDETAILRFPRVIQAGMLALIILAFLYQVVIDESITASFVYQGF